MPGFPPGIGEVNMHGRQRRVGKKFAKHSQPIAEDDPRVVQPSLGQPGRRVQRVLASDLQAEEVPVGLSRCR